MTDLERVRETLEDLASYPSKPPKRMRELAEAAIPAIDAHLKEDAERDSLVKGLKKERKILSDKNGEVYRELTRLRERVKELEAYASAMRGSDI